VVSQVIEIFAELHDDAATGCGALHVLHAGAVHRGGFQCAEDGLRTPTGFRPVMPTAARSSATTAADKLTP
jgi:hypothetical protein